MQRVVLSLCLPLSITTSYPSIEFYDIVNFWISPSCLWVFSFCRWLVFLCGCVKILCPGNFAKMKYISLILNVWPTDSYRWYQFQPPFHTFSLCTANEQSIERYFQCTGLSLQWVHLPFASSAPCILSLTSELTLWFPVWTEAWWLSRNPPHLQCLIGPPEASSLRDWAAPGCLAFLWRAPVGWPRLFV